MYEVKVLLLHFGKRKRGKLREDTQFFTGDPEQINSFVPKKLTRRHVTSKYASIFDPTGKLGPALADTKDLLRETIEATDGWDTAMPDTSRDRGLKQFLFWEKLKT